MCVHAYVHAHMCAAYGHMCMCLSVHLYTCVVCVCTSVCTHNVFSSSQFFWALGAILETLLALVVMTNIEDSINWRWLLGLSAVPVGLMCFVIPVSICVCCVSIVCKFTINFKYVFLLRMSNSMLH